jgi:hypothetical protein
MLSAVPTIVSLKEYLDNIRQAEVTRVRGPTGRADT